MKISTALAGVRQLYIETAPLIYYVELNPDYTARMDAIVAAIETASIEAVSSVITLVEVLSHPMKVGDQRLIQEYRDILVNSGEFRLVPVTARIAEYAAEMRARYNLRTPDALHVSSAVLTGCDAFLTNDAGLERVTEIRILVLNALELDVPSER
ncbi:MAG: type II toxin-antitoxin system VapC family toxin [Anaerolineae bacterium]|nr:type II toxin-antitoxin system VapC family toxin [Anaerolineae bacterium]